MTHDPAATRLYHITDVSNLPAILAAGGLLSDVALSGVEHQVIGYDHIKQRRRPAGCQRSIVHLVTNVSRALALGQPWAIADGNAGAGHTSFSADLAALDALDWAAIRATQWQGRTHQKSAEFLVADLFPWRAIEAIGCPNGLVAQRVAHLLAGQPNAPAVAVQPSWYYP